MLIKGKADNADKRIMLIKGKKLKLLIKGTKFGQFSTNKYKMRFLGAFGPIREKILIFARYCFIHSFEEDEKNNELYLLR